MGVFCVFHILCNYLYHHSLSSFHSISHVFNTSPTLLLLHNYDYYLETVKNKHSQQQSLLSTLRQFQFHTLLLLIQANVDSIENGIDLSHSIIRDIQKIRDSPNLQWEKIRVDDVFQENSKRGILMTDTSIPWESTVVQKRLLDATNNNNLKLLIRIHPSLLFDPKMVGKADSGVFLVTFLFNRKSINYVI